MFRTPLQEEQMVPGADAQCAAVATLDWLDIPGFHLVKLRGFVGGTMRWLRQTECCTQAAVE